MADTLWTMVISKDTSGSARVKNLICHVSFSLNLFYQTACTEILKPWEIYNCHKMICYEVMILMAYGYLFREVNIQRVSIYILFNITNSYIYYIQMHSYSHKIKRIKRLQSVYRNLFCFSNSFLRLSMKFLEKRVALNLTSDDLSPCWWLILSRDFCAKNKIIFSK